MLQALLGVAVAALLAQFASGPEATEGPFIAPDTVPGLRFCDALWQQLSGDCNACHTAWRLLRDLGLVPLVPCPA